MRDEDVFAAVRTGDRRLLTDAITQGAIGLRDRDQLTLLHQAIACRDEATALWLIDRGVDVNAQDRRGMTALHFAALYNMPVIAEAIMAHGGNVHIVDEHGNQALWTAVMNARAGDTAVVRLLLLHGADPLHENRHGRSPLGFAKAAHRAEVAAALEQHARGRQDG